MYNTYLIDNRERTHLRKTQVMVSKSLDKDKHTHNHNNNNNNTSTDTITSNSNTNNNSDNNSTHNANLKDDALNREISEENYFMPKKKILRSDGASLFDVYASKREDYWGKILKAQILEEEQQKMAKRNEKHEQDEEYGRLLKRQVEEAEHRKQLMMQSNNDFAILEHATVNTRYIAI
jgi:hypothetical protein